jgi:cell division transport system permease protein
MSAEAGAWVSRWRPGPLLPPRDARDGSLVFVTAVLCFLACLTAIGALGADRAARGWTRQLSDSATVVVRTEGAQSPDQAAALAAEALAGVRGVTEARALEKERAIALIEPWIGRDALIDDLPVPRLVTVALDPITTTAGALTAALKTAGVDATVDDHSRWIGDIERAARIARWSALGVFALIASAAAAVVVFAVRAGLAARHDVVEVLHLSGARRSYIANLFAFRFGVMAAFAGLLGGSAAAMIAAAARLAGGGDGFTPVLPLAWTDLAAAAPCPLVAGMVAALAARAAAARLLKEMT